MAKLSFAFPKTAPLESMIYQILDIRDALKTANGDLIIEAITLDSSSKEGISEEYYERLISREDAKEAIEDYTTYPQRIEIENWFEKAYSSQRYPKIPISDFVFELYTHHNKSLTLYK